MDRVVCSLLMLSCFEAFLMPQQGAGFYLGHVSPSDPVVRKGENLTLLCVLETIPDPALNASHLYWYKNGSQRPLVASVVNSTAIALTLENLKRADSGSWWCQLNQTSVGGPTGFVGATFLSVGEPPEIGNMTCISRNHEDLRCSFCPENWPTPDQTAYRIEYTVNGKQWTACAPNKCYCHLNLRDIIIGVPYHFSINASNVWGVESNNALLPQPRLVVKPNPVQSLEVVALNSSALEVSFDPPSNTGYLGLHYRIVVTSSTERMELEAESNTSTVVDGLSAFTGYTVSVYGFVPGGQYESDAEATVCLTLTDAPSAAPPLRPGSFRRGTACANPPNSYDVLFFWEDVPAEHQQGPIDGYIARALGRTSTLRPGDNSFLVKCFPDGQPLTFSIQAYNYGQQEWENEQLLSPTASITRPAKLPSRPVREVAELREEEVMWLSWELDDQHEPADNFTLFYCKATVVTECQGPLKTKSLSGDTREYQLAHQENTRYALAVNTAHGSSGMSETWLCQYYHDAEPAEVPFAITPGDFSLKVDWTEPQCYESMKYGLVTNYSIDCICDRGEESRHLVSNTERSFTITSLSAFNACNVSMSGFSVAGEGTLSSQAAVTNEAVAGAPPQSVQLSNITSDTISVAWQPSPEPNGRVLHYSVYINDKEQVVQSVLEATFHGLEGWKNHSVEVVEVNGAGPSPPSAPVIAFTPMRAPTPPTDVQLDVEDPLLLNVSWTAPEQLNGPLSQYRLMVSWGEKAPPVAVNVSGSLEASVLEAPCQGETLRAGLYMMAVNVGGDVAYESDPSREHFATVCQAKLSNGEIGGIVIAVVCTIILIILGIFRFGRKCNQLHRGKEDIHLPKEEGYHNPAMIKEGEPPYPPPDLLVIDSGQNGYVETVTPYHTTRKKQLASQVSEDSGCPESPQGSLDGPSLETIDEVDSSGGAGGYTSGNLRETSIVNTDVTGEPQEINSGCLVGGAIHSEQDGDEFTRAEGTEPGSGVAHPSAQTSSEEMEDPVSTPLQSPAGFILPLPQIQTDNYHENTDSMREMSDVEQDIKLGQNTDEHTILPVFPQHEEVDDRSLPENSPSNTPTAVILNPPQFISNQDPDNNLPEDDTSVSVAEPSHERSDSKGTSRGGSIAPYSQLAPASEAGSAGYAGTDPLWPEGPPVEPQYDEEFAQQSNPSEAEHQIPTPLSAIDGSVSLAIPLPSIDIEGGNSSMESYPEENTYDSVTEPSHESSDSKGTSQGGSIAPYSQLAPASEAGSAGYAGTAPLWPEGPPVEPQYDEEFAQQSNPSEAEHQLPSGILAIPLPSLDSEGGNSSIEGYSKMAQNVPPPTDSQSAPNDGETIIPMLGVPLPDSPRGAREDFVDDYSPVVKAPTHDSAVGSSGGDFSESDGDSSKQQWDSSSRSSDDGYTAGSKEMCTGGRGEQAGWDNHPFTPEHMPEPKPFFIPMPFPIVVQNVEMDRMGSAQGTLDPTNDSMV